VPVYPGSINFVRPYFYEGIAKLDHIVFLSFIGEPVTRRIMLENNQRVTQQVECSAWAIYKLGILHKDLMPRNILWNKGTLSGRR